MTHRKWQLHETDLRGSNWNFISCLMDSLCIFGGEGDGNVQQTATTRMTGK